MWLINTIRGKIFKDNLYTQLVSYLDLVDTLGVFSSDSDYYYQTLHINKYQVIYAFKRYATSFDKYQFMLLKYNNDYILGFDGFDPYITLDKYEKIYNDVIPSLKNLEVEYIKTRNSINERLK